MAGHEAVVFRESVDKRTEMSMLMQQIKKQWSDDDYKRTRDLQKYALDKEDAWVLDKALVDFVGDVLKSISVETKIRLMRVLAVCALKQSFVHFLHQDRERRYLMNYINGFVHLSLDEKKAVGLFICHLFANAQTQNWALYFSDWETDDEDDPETTSNARITGKVTRLCLQDLNPTLQSYGGAIVYNLAIRRVRVMQRPVSVEDEVTADTENVSHSAVNGAVATLRAQDAVCLELTMCILELLTKGTFKLTEVVLFQCLTALVSFIPLIKSDLSYYHESFDQVLKSLVDKKLSERNEKLVQDILAQI